MGVTGDVHGSMRYDNSCIDAPDDLDKDNFEIGFNSYFNLIDKKSILETKRKLFFYERK